MDTHFLQNLFKIDKYPQITHFQLFFEISQKPRLGPPFKKIWHGAPLHTTFNRFWVWGSICYKIRVIAVSCVFGENCPKLPLVDPFIKIIYIIIIFFLLLNLGVWEFVIFFYGVILRFWRFSLRHTFQKSYRLSINYGNFLYFPQITRKCMFVSHISSYFSFKLLLVSHSTMLNRFKLIGTLNHIDIEFYVAKIAIFSIFCCFLPLFWQKWPNIWDLYTIMTFHPTSQVKNSRKTSCD